MATTATSTPTPTIWLSGRLQRRRRAPGNLQSAASPYGPGGQFVSRFTAPALRPSSVVNFFVATATGPVNAGPFTPSASSLPTQLAVMFPPTTPLGQGFVDLQVVNTDKGFLASNLASAFCRGSSRQSSEPNPNQRGGSCGDQQQSKFRNRQRRDGGAARQRRSGAGRRPDSTPLTAWQSICFHLQGRENPQPFSLILEIPGSPESGLIVLPPSVGCSANRTRIVPGKQRGRREKLQQEEQRGFGADRTANIDLLGDARRAGRSRLTGRVFRR